MKTRICLNMIVRDEAAVIERCLASVRPFIDHWVIVDTGSVDNTPQRIASALAGIPGELHRRPWKNFGHNRTEALNLAKEHGDYLLFIDADECLRAPDGFVWPALTDDAYYLNAEYGATLYSRCALVSARLEWKWSGVLHEYLESTPQAHIGHLNWPRMVVQHDGARARDPKTYEKDAAILERALMEDPLNSRNAFYLAQSWRDAGEPVKALAAYRHRVSMAGFEEETWYALFEIAKLTEQLGGSLAEVRSAYLDAYQRRPSRAEPLYKLAYYHRNRNELALAYLFARQAAAIPRPNDLLFIDEGVYTWCSLDELATAAYWVGAFEEGRKATERMLAEGHVPASHRARIETNLGQFPPPAATGPRTNRRAAYSICIMSFAGYAHSRVFEDVALALQEGFAELGEVVPIVYDTKNISGRGVILGANLLSLSPNLVIPDDAIIFNLEQASDASGWLSDAYLGLLRSHEVWDYSEFNMAMLRTKGVVRARQCAIGYAPCLTRITPAIEEDIDVLFYGQIDGRRIPILQAIEATGLRVHRLFAVYGGERDTWIARSKIVLNLHAHPEQVFEIVRLSFLLANRRFVISEPGRGSDQVEVSLRNGIVFGTAEQLPELCKRYVADETSRRAVADRGFELFSSIRQADSLRAVLDRSVTPKAAGVKTLVTSSIGQQDWSNVLAKTVKVTLPLDPTTTNKLSLYPATTVTSLSSVTRVQQQFHFKLPATDESAPKVLLAILAKQKEATLPFYLRCIEALDYPKSAIALYIRTNNNTDRTTEVLRHWLDGVGAAYASVEFDCSDVAAPVQQYGVHEWNETRFKVLGRIRQVSLQKAIDAGCDFYFVADVDNFVRPNTLRDLVALNLPIVGPLLRHEAPERAYSNYHHEIDANGYLVDSEEYYWLLNQRIRGVAEVKVIHCTYLVRRDCLGALRYDDGSQRHEYVIFSASARSAGIPQYLDNREIYGYLTLEENPDRCKTLLGDEIEAALTKAPDRMRVVP